MPVKVPGPPGRGARVSSDMVNFYPEKGRPGKPLPNTIGL
jgi:hypothetical protein